MVTIIAGDRGFKDYKKFCGFLEEIGTDVSYVYTSGETGANKMGSRWAFEHSIPHSRFPSSMKKFMTSQADDLVYFKKKSKIVPTLVKQARAAGLEIYEYEF